ncbi:MAG TPA: 16S rRNA (guanine(527)-N(7))-methyltransferase RsmG [Fibrobacteraceae bacterium]|nr:16S rRNA (guanine(527)-N(7))-methyltransferase RsmG [Fibrobacteraceae bacterium]
MSSFDHRRPEHRKPPRTSGFPLFHGRRLAPSRRSLETLLQYYGVELQSNTLDQLWEFHQLLRSHNGDQDLTRLNAFETIVERHYADCTLINAFVEEWPRTMLDIGSGAGFPGIPLKLVNPDIHLTLCEPRPNRVQFLELVIRELGLANIEVFGHKATSNSLRTPVDGVITRAFETMDKTLLRVANALKPGGHAFFMKGPAVREEMRDFNAPDYQIVGEHFYSIPNSTQERALFVLERAPGAF